MKLFPAFLFFTTLSVMLSCKSNKQKQLESHQIGIRLHYDFAYMYKSKAADALLECLGEMQKCDSMDHVLAARLWLTYETFNDSAEKHASRAADLEAALYSLLK